MNRQNALRTPWLCCVAATLAFALAAPRAFAAVINVENPPYNVVPNNGSDATAGIQAALTAANPNDEVYLPAGTYWISASLAPKSNTIVKGAGVGTTTILYVGTAAHSLFYLLNVNGVEVAYLTLDGDNGASDVLDGIKADTCANLYIHDLMVQNIGPANGGDGIQLAENVTGSRFENCSFSNIGVGSAWSSGFRISSASSNNTISGNTIDNTGRGGVLCDTNSTGLFIQRNTITHSGGNQLGIELFGGCDEAVVEDNNVDHWISISGSSYAAVRRNTVGTTDGTYSLTALECVSSHDSIFTDTVSSAGNELGISVSAGPEQYDFFAYNTFTNQANWSAQIQGNAGGATSLYFYKDKYQSGLNNSSIAYYPPPGNAFRINGNANFLTLDSVSITNNPGAAIQILGVGSNVDALSVVNCTITGNGSVQGWGGSFSNLQWANNTVSGNGNNSVPTSLGFSDAIPVAIINGPSTVAVNQPVTFTSGSTDAGGTIAPTLWDLNAGPPMAATSATYTYTTPGAYRISLLVWDTDGRGAHAEQTLTVTGNLWLEAEDLDVAAQTAGITARVGTDNNMSAGAGAFFDATAAGQSVTYDVPNIAAGTYDVRIGLKAENNKGQWQLNVARLDGTGSNSNVGPVIDEGAAGTPTNPVYTYVDLGNWTAGSTSDKAFKFTVVGENANSSGSGIDIDYIEINAAPVSAAQQQWFNWLAQYGLLGALAEPTADPENDGVTNIWKYFTNANPNALGSPANLLPQLSLYNGGANGNSLQFTCLRRIDYAARGFSIVVQTSPDLAAGVWTTQPTTQESATPTGDGVTETAVIRLNSPIPAGTNQLFARAQLTLAN